jgi:C-terminal processing protease CtpA/Prc
MEQGITMKNFLFKGIVSILIVSILSTCSSTLQETSSPTATCTPVPALRLLGKYELLSPEDMSYDLEELFHRLEAGHPDLYAKRSKVEVDLECQQLQKELSQPLTAIEYYRRVAPLVNSLGDYHTGVRLPDAVINTLSSSEKLVPIEAEMKGQQVYIISTYSNSAIIKPGMELLEVNGTPISVILAEVRRYLPSIDRYISPFYFWLILGSSTRYELKLVPSGKTEPVTLLVPGLTHEEMEEQRKSSPVPKSVIYTSLPGEEIGVLTINSFMYTGLELRDEFVQIQKDNIQHLIIDIRSNSGGQYDQVESAMDYLTDRPFQVCSRRYIHPVHSYNSQESGETDCEEKKPYESPERYHGKIYLLIGPDTYSAAVTFAAILQDYSLATIIGEETLASASYCADSLIEILQKLPRTGLQYQYSRTCYVRPSGIFDERGVIPDIIIETTIEDQITGNDRVLNYTLEMIRDGVQAP